MPADYKKDHHILIGGMVVGVVPAGGTSYVNPYGGEDIATTGRVEIEIPFACILDMLNIRGFTAPGVGEDFTWTLMVNGNAMALTAQIAGAVDTEADDVVNQVAVAAGDTVCMRIVTSGAAAATYQRYSMRCKPL